MATKTQKARAAAAGKASRLTSSSTTRCCTITDGQPESLGELSQIGSVGPAKRERYGDVVLAML